MLMQLVAEHAQTLGVAPCCSALGVSRASYYRFSAPFHGPHQRRKVPRALSQSEQQQVLSMLRSERFIDQAPAQVFASLLDQGRYLCSERTMYRLLRSHGEVRERRDQLRHPSYPRPE
jgi:putative transposase